MSTDQQEGALPEISEEDSLAILDYLDGQMAPEKMVEFEIRLTNAPELAAAFESFESLDRLQRSALLAEPENSRFRLLRGGSGIGLAAAAACLLVVAGYLLNRPTGDPRSFDLVPAGADRRYFELAVLPSAFTPQEFHRELGLSGEEALLLPESWPETLRSPGEGETSISDRAYYERVAPVLAARAHEALAIPPQDVFATRFLLPLRPTEDVSAVVLLVDSSGIIWDEDGKKAGQIAFPTDTQWDHESGRLVGGEVRILPQPSIRWAEGEAGSRLAPFESGFAVRRGVGTLTVLVGVRAQPLDEALRGSLAESLGALADAPTEGRSLDQLAAWLDQNEFEIQGILLHGKQ